MDSTTTLIVLPSNFITNIGSQVATVFTSLSPLISFILGVLLAVFAIGAIISWIKH